MPNRYHADSNGVVHLRHERFTSDFACADDECNRQHVHVYTDDELRARDERLIVAAFHRVTGSSYVDSTRPADVYVDSTRPADVYDAIIASV